MESCGHFQALMLDHLYDLLEAQEEQALGQHVEQCASCQAARSRARQQQALLAAAARMEFPQVRFAPPQDPLVPATEPVTVSPLQRRQPAWFVLALSVLLVVGVGTIAVLGARLWTGYRQQQQLAVQAHKDHEDSLAKAHMLEHRHKTKLALLKKDTQSLQEEWTNLPGLRQKDMEKLAQRAKAEQLNVLVLGQAMQPGRPNDYTILTKDLNGTPVSTKVEARLVDQNKKVVARPAVEPTGQKGQYKLALQPDVPLYPNQHLTLEVVAQREDGAKVPVSGPVDVAGKPMYFTHLATDKPLYQIGETVHFRSLTLDRATMKPPSEDLQVVFTIIDSSQAHAEVYNSGPKTALLMDAGGRPILGPKGQLIRGIGAGEFVIDSNNPNLSGGEFTLTVKELQNRFQPQTRKFHISRYEPPQLNKELDFGQKSYGAGQDVTATATAVRASNLSKLGDARVEMTINIDGKWYDPAGKESAGEQKIALKTDKDGVLKLHFKLPEKIERGDASLSVVFYDGNSPETIARAIPVVLKKLNVEFFPEGGDLVAGLANRVYFQVRSTLDKPADLRGSIVYDDGGQEKVAVADVRTLHDDSKEVRGYNLGMGAFTITPAAGRKYRLKIEEPIGIDNKPEFPVVKDSGIVMTIPGGVFADREPMQVTIRSTSANRSFWVGAYCRGRVVDQQSVELKDAKEATVALKPAAGTGGVCRVTVFEEKKAEDGRAKMVPVAERLVYRMPVERLNLSLAPDQARYIPGQKVSIRVQGVDENEDAAGAIVLLYVVDKRTLTLADEKTARSMPTQFFLAPEIRSPEELEYADFLLSEEPKLKNKAREALDLLLGTQGWRRFAEQNPDEFRRKHPGSDQQDVERLLVLNGQSASGQTLLDLRRDERSAMIHKYQAHWEELQDKLVQTQEDTRAESQAAEQDREKNAKAAAVAIDQFSASAAELEQYEARFARLRLIVLPLLVVLLAVCGIVSLAIGMVRSAVRAVPYYAVTSVCLVVLLAVSGFFLWQHREYQDVARVDQESLREEAAFLQSHETRKLAQAELGDLAKNQNGPALAPMAAAPMPGDAEGFPFGGAGAAGAAGRGFGQAKLAAEAPAAPANLADKAAKGENRLERDFDKKADKARDLKPKFKVQVAAGDEVERKAFLQKRGADRANAEQLRRLRMMPAAARPPGGLGGRRAPGLEFEDGLMAGRKVPPPMPFIVREFAYKARPHTGNDERRDFVETLYWNPALVLADGKPATIGFDLCDSVTTYQVVAFGHTPDGRLGAAATTIESSLPFTIEPKLPLEVTANDKVGVAVKVSNSTAVERTVTLQVEANGLRLIDGGSSQQLVVPANQALTRIFRFQPTIVDGTAELTFIGESMPFAKDIVKKTLKVAPDGFPIVKSHSDVLEGQSSNTVTLPETWIKDTLHCQVDVYPSTLADLQKGLESLLREPNGCFEQTSTSNYPNLLILDYLRASNQSKPELEQHARDLLGRGYQKLTSFECQPPGAKKEGYEWFGGPSPAHEALTAYGLLQFRDMARVMKVDADMLKRTSQYLMEQKDGKGGFKRNPRALDSFGRAPDNITNAYIVWAITESGKDDDVEKEIVALYDQAKSSKDPYFLALVANSLLNRSKTKDGQEVLTKLAGLQKDDGHLDAASTSITCSGGRDLQIETTGLSVLAWLKRPEFNLNAQKAIKWISQQRGGYGGFGATQSTILALKAIIAYTQANKKTAEAGTLTLTVNEQRVASLDFAAGQTEVLSMTVPNPEKYLKPGDNKVRVEVTGNNSFPHTLSWSYRTVKPASAEACPLRLTTRMDRTIAQEGDTARLTVTIENTGKKDANMPVAIIGLPGGTTLPEDLKQFADLARPRDDGKKPGLISAYELRSNNRELVLYWRGLGAGEKVEVPLQVICRVPGEYHGPASRAYLYYNADTKCWIDAIAIAIKE